MLVFKGYIEMTALYSASVSKTLVFVAISEFYQLCNFQMRFLYISQAHGFEFPSRIEIHAKMKFWESIRSLGSVQTEAQNASIQAIVH